jgi:hypothetical protein
MKSLYGNVIYGKDATKLNGEKITVFRPMTFDQVKLHCGGRQFIAFNDKGLRVGFKTWLYLNFPEASSFEKSNMDPEPFMDILQWLNTEENEYQAGYDLFEKYGRSKKVKRYLSREENNGRRMKLEHQLRELLNYL